MKEYIVQARAQETIDSFDAHNAPELIRCKDCKYCVKEPNGKLFCDILAIEYEPLGSKKVNADWFCADGERRDDNG